MSTRTEAIVAWLRDRLAGSGARGFVVGVSGGIDSAVVARLCQLSAPGNVIGALLPCHSDAADEADARLVADHFAIPVVRAELSAAFDVLIAEVQRATAAIPPEQAAAAPADDVKARVPAANVKPRLRMVALYYLANSLDYLVAGTGNRSELAIGYFTKYGDGGVDLLPIGHLLKSEVRELARELGVPEAILDKTPRAGLWPGQTDEAEMGFSYAALENYLTKGPEAVAPALAMRIERLARNTEHKRALAPSPGLRPTTEI